jgi:hypothetical protein
LPTRDLGSSSICLPVTTPCEAVSGAKNAPSVGAFQPKALAGASFASVAQLVQAIRDFIGAYNRNAAPFVWRKREVKRAQLGNIIVNLRY